MARMTDEGRAAYIAARKAQIEKEAAEKEAVKKILREQLELLAEKKQDCTIEQLTELSAAITEIAKILLI